jgi:YVTN family beta-propeller protein
VVVRPSGTVTFLFTDVEGSTRLLKQLRDGYGDALAQHQGILREAFAAHGGEEVDTQGDAFFYVFARAREAAEAAAAGQRALAAHAWPDGAELRVRVGMHTGEPAVSADGRYHGLGVHRTARIMAAGHGGQILISQATASVLEDDEPPGIRLRDLGQHRLKDLDRPEHIYQLDVDGLPQDFGPLVTESVARGAASRAPWRAAYWTRRRLAASAAGIVVAAAAMVALIALAFSDSTQALAEVDANAVGFVDSGTGRIHHQVDAGATPTHLAIGEGAIWVTNADDHSVSRIDPRTRTVVQTIEVGNSPSGIVTGNGAVWVANNLDGTVSRIDPDTNRGVQQVVVGNAPVGITYAAGSVWVANTGDDTITRIDADSGRPAKPLAIAATELGVGAGTLWATQPAANRVVRIDPATGKVVQPIAVGNGPLGFAFGRGSAWIANSLDGTVSRVDPATNAVAGVTSVGNGVRGLAAGAPGVWVSTQFDGRLSLIDPRTNDVVRRVPIGNRPQGVAISGEDVLVAVRQSGAGHRGGTLRMRTSRAVAGIDPAVAWDTSTTPMLRMAYDGLVGFNQASGAQGTQLVPNLAVSLPTPTDDGKTYTFRLRPNVRFSTGRRVRPSDVRHTFERLFAIGKSGAIPSHYYDRIVGAHRCKQGHKCDLSRGIVADDASNVVTFHLVAPDPEFLYKLAMNSAYIVPRATSLTEALAEHPLPATGPYIIARYRPNRVLRLIRNPHFREWSKAAQPDGYPDEIVLDIGGTPDRAANDVIGGKADLFTTSQSQTPPTQPVLTSLKTRYGGQVHTNPQAATIALFLNTRLPPFDRVEARKAVNYAADRAAAVEAAGGPDVAQATCQILPPGLPGYRPHCPYTAGPTSEGRWTAPDLAKARALVTASGTRGMKVTVWSWADLPGIGPYTVRLLRSLGYRVSMKKALPEPPYFEVVLNPRTRAQIATNEWIADYPRASGFFGPVLTCKSFVPNAPLNLNGAAFCDPRIDRQIERASAEQVTNPDAARGLWERVDRQTVAQAPWLALVNPKAVDVLSKRVGNYQFSPNGGLLIDQLWVR